MLSPSLDRQAELFGVAGEVEFSSEVHGPTDIAESRKDFLPLRADSGPVETRGGQQLWD